MNPSLARPKSCSTKRRLALGAGLMTWALLAAACSSTPSPSSTSGAGGNTGATTAPSPSLHYGASISITTSDGYQYGVKAAALSEKADVSDESGNTGDSPPGKTYILATVLVTNPLSGGKEPVTAFDPSSGLNAVSNSVLELTASPTSAWNSTFACPPPANTGQTGSTGSTGNTGAATTTTVSDFPPSTLCTQTVSYVVSDSAFNATPSGTPQLAPGASTTIQVAFGPVPTGPSTSVVSLYANGIKVPLP